VQRGGGKGEERRGRGGKEREGETGTVRKRRGGGLCSPALQKLIRASRSLTLSLHLKSLRTNAEPGIML